MSKTWIPVVKNVPHSIKDLNVSPSICYYMAKLKKRIKI